VRYVVIAVLLAACSHPPEPKAANRPPGKGSGAPVPIAGGGSNVGQDPVAEPHDVPCSAPTCAFHAGAAAYFTCLAGGAGACFHFGARCAPSDGCMFDPGDRKYKHCNDAVEGVCRTWAAACEPASKCMFNPADGLHHHCDDASGGTCTRWGALCAP
jgi:hypothetical protein